MLHLLLGELGRLLEQLPPDLLVTDQVEKPGGLGGLGGLAKVEKGVRVHSQQEGNHLFVREMGQSYLASHSHSRFLSH